MGPDTITTRAPNPFTNLLQNIHKQIRLAFHVLVQVMQYVKAQQSNKETPKYHLLSDDASA